MGVLQVRRPVPQRFYVRVERQPALLEGGGQKPSSDQVPLPGTSTSFVGADHSPGWEEEGELGILGGGPVFNGQMEAEAPPTFPGSSCQQGAVVGVRGPQVDSWVPS